MNHDECKLETHDGLTLRDTQEEDAECHSSQKSQLLQQEMMILCGGDMNNSAVGALAVEVIAEDMNDDCAH